MFVWIHTCIQYAQACTCVCKWKLEFHLGCHLPGAVHPFETGSITGLELSKGRWLGAQWVTRITCLPLPSAGITRAPYHDCFCLCVSPWVILRMKCRSSHLQNKCRATSSAPPPALSHCIPRDSGRHRHDVHSQWLGVGWLDGCWAHGVLRRCLCWWDLRVSHLEDPFYCVDSD